MYHTVLGALIGLVRSTEGNEDLITPETSQIILEGLTLPPEAGSQDIQTLLEKIGKEKQRLVPNCFYCACPCGRTSDYDMREIQLNSPEVQALKQNILRGLRCAATTLRNGIFPAESLSEAASATVSGDISSCTRQTIYRALYSIGTDWAPEDLMTVLNDLDTL